MLTKEQEEQVFLRGYARTREEWWYLLNRHWTCLSRLTETYLNQKEQDILARAIKNESAEAAWLQLQKTWERLPDRGWVRRIPGFGILCDLCSDFPEPANEEETKEEESSLS